MNNPRSTHSPVGGQKRTVSDAIIASAALVVCVLTAGFGGLAAAFYCALQLRVASVTRARASVVMFGVSLVLCLLFVVAAALWFLTDNVGGGGPIGSRWSEAVPFLGVNLAGGALVIGSYWFYRARTSK